MANRYVEIAAKPIVDYEDQFAQVNVAAGATGTQILSFTVKFGKIARIVGLGMAWDSAIDTKLTWHLNVNGNPKYPYNATKVQLTPPETDYMLPVEIPVDQGAIISVTADSTAGAAGNVTGRVRVNYYDIYPLAGAYG